MHSLTNVYNIIWVFFLEHLPFSFLYDPSLYENKRCAMPHQFCASLNHVLAIRWAIESTLIPHSPTAEHTIKCLLFFHKKPPKKANKLIKYANSRARPSDIPCFHASSIKNWHAIKKSRLMQMRGPS